MNKFPSLLKISLSTCPILNVLSPNTENTGKPNVEDTVNCVEEVNSVTSVPSLSIDPILN